MKVAIYKEKGRIELKDIPIPQPASHEVLIRITACCICASDISRIYYDTAVPGVVLGHEWVGVVERVGECVSHFKPGDRVVPSGAGQPMPSPRPVSPNDPAPAPQIIQGARARHSPRDNGRTCFPGTNEQGGFAEYTLRSAWRVGKVPDNMTDFQAACCEPLAVAVHAVRISGVQLGDTVAVIGLGAVGLFVVQCAKLQGATKIVAVDPDPYRRELARRYGANTVIDPNAGDALDAIVAAAGGNGPLITYECAGAPDTLQQAMESVTFGGKVVLVAVRWAPTTVTPVEWLGRQPQLIFSYAYGPEGWPTAIHLLATGQVTIDGMVSKDRAFPLSRLQEALEQTRNKQANIVKAIIVPAREHPYETT